MHTVHTPFCAATGLANLQGRITGNAHRLDRPFTTRIAFGLLVTLHFLGKLLPKAANKNTHHIDTTLAYSLGNHETGPDGFIGGMTYKKSMTSIPLADDYCVLREEDENSVSLSLVHNGKTVFSRSLTLEGISQHIDPFFEPKSWEDVDKWLATFLVPYHDIDMKSARANLARALDIPLDSFQQ